MLASHMVNATALRSPISLALTVAALSASPILNQQIQAEAGSNQEGSWEQALIYVDQVAKDSLVLPSGYVPKRPGHYSRDDWTEVIDSTWGPGLPSEFNCSIFWDFWNTIDEEFACFQDLYLDWDSVFTAVLPEISQEISRGRFAAILCHAAFALKESHTRCFDWSVSFETELAPGVPIMYIGPPIMDEHFGAALTPLPDSSLLVCKVGDNHPLNLVPGDNILGYDGVPWKQLYPEILEAQLPLRGLSGSSQSAISHRLLAAAGLNWHLFDTLDIIKYATGDTIHLPTSLLCDSLTPIFTGEQLEIPGVPLPDDWDDVVTWGLVEGTAVGYIYVIAWYGAADVLFEQAVQHFMDEVETIGLIVDFRFNGGGNMHLAYPGLEHLFDSTVHTVGFDQRGDPDDHDSMVTAPGGEPGNFKIEGDPSDCYDKPIAVLTGPGAVSSGDQIALALSVHPMARVFGKPTAGAFNSPVGRYLSSGDVDIYLAHALWDAWWYDNPGHYLTRDELPEVDETVWLTQDGVAQGRDDVVEAALTWIMAQDADGDGIPNGVDICPTLFDPGQDDSDDDGVGNLCDNCPDLPNADQTDSDGDGTGDTCDADLDGDGVPNYADNCPLTDNPDQFDSDNDGVGEACDNCETVPNSDQYDENSDGVGDACDGQLHVQSYEIPDGYLGIWYEYYFWAVGGTEPYYWSLVAGAVPDGCSFQGGALGRINGTPNEVGTCYLTVALEDSGFPISYDTLDVSVTISDVPIICGDADRNMIVNVSDAVFLISYIFGGGPAPDPLSAGDVDCNQTVNVSDAVYLIAYIFAGGPAPCPEC